MQHDAAANPGNSVLATSVANIGAGNGAVLAANNGSIQGTTAFLRVGLGLTGTGTTPCFTSLGVFDPSCAGDVYDGVISLGNLSTSSNGPGKNSQATSVTEHEIGEVLGGGGTGTTLGQSGSSASLMGPTDLYRYKANGADCSTVSSTPSFNTNSSTVSCYSIDGCKTALVQMNQAGGGSDFGDFAFNSVSTFPTTNTPEIQDAFDSCVSNVYSDLSPEFTMMESIGYDANLPEPSALALFSGAIAALGLLHLRRARYRASRVRHAVDFIESRPITCLTHGEPAG